MKQQFFSEDDFYLLRKHIKEVYDESCSYIKSSDKILNILEIGPCKQNHFSGLEVDWLEKNASFLGHNYKTFDICGDVDYRGSIEDCKHLFSNETFDVIIVLSVLEHVEDIFKAANEIARICKPQGRVFIETPFMFKVHGPVPDYWRLSEYAYQCLFSNMFEINMNSYPKNSFGKNSFALSYGATLIKK